MNEIGLGHINFLPVKGRNSLLDRVFYDVDSLTAEEQDDLSPLTDREGTVVLVYPSSASKRICHYRNVLQLLLRSGEEVEGVAVAGVGSSVLGTAALARNVADAINGPVAGVVSGYGLTDLMAEALGGWFFFGGIERAKYKAESAAASLLHGDIRAISIENALSAENAMLDGLPLQADTTALLDILEAAPRNLRWLVGHSKGCLMIDFVLERYIRGRAGELSELYDRLNIVTLGAVVDLPSKFKKVTQLIGAIDGFGKLNSSLGVRHIEVPGAWHHLNRNAPAHLDAVTAIRSIIGGSSIGTEPSSPAPRPSDFWLRAA